MPSVSQTVPLWAPLLAYHNIACSRQCFSLTLSRMRRAAPLAPLSSKVMGASRSRAMAMMVGSAGVASSAAMSAASFDATGSSTWCYSTPGVLDRPAWSGFSKPQAYGNSKHTTRLTKAGICDPAEHDHHTPSDAREPREQEWHIQQVAPCGLGRFRENLALAGSRSRADQMPTTCTARRRPSRVFATASTRLHTAQASACEAAANAEPSFAESKLQGAQAADNTLMGFAYLGSAAPMVLRNTLAYEVAPSSTARLFWLPCRTESTTYSMPIRLPSSGSCGQQAESST